MKKKILIEGMSCGNCVKHVTNALNDLDGVTDVNVNLGEKYALVDVAESVKDEIIKETIEEAGYDVVGIEAI